MAQLELAIEQDGAKKAYADSWCCIGGAGVVCSYRRRWPGHWGVGSGGGCFGRKTRGRRQAAGGGVEKSTSDIPTLTASSVIMAQSAS